MLRLHDSLTSGNGFKVRLLLTQLGLPFERIEYAGGEAALGVMEQRLATRAFFVGERYSIADIALYAYTHVAGEGGFDLAPYPSVRAWLGRVAAQPGYIPITRG